MGGKQKIRTSLPIVALVILVASAAAAAQKQGSFGSVTFAERVENGRAVKPTFRFPAGIREIFAVFDYAAIPPKSHWSWIRFAFATPGQTTQLLIFLALVFAVAYVLSRINRRRMAALAAVLDERTGKITGIFFELWVDGHFQGRPVEFTTKARGHQSSKFTLSLSTSAPLQFRITRELLRDRLMQSLKMQSELKAGDPEFDRKFALASDTPERFLPWLQRPDVRAAISAMVLDRGVDVLLLDGRQLRLLYLNYSGRNMRPESVRAVLEHAQTLLTSAELLS